MVGCHLLLDIDLEVILTIVKENHSKKSIGYTSYKVFQAICQENSIDFRYTPRVQNRIRYFVSDLIKRLKNPGEVVPVRNSFFVGVNRNKNLN